MKKRILAYLDFLSKAEIEEMSPEELAYFKEDLLRQIEYFQHERLIHLIVTVLFAVLTFLSLMIAVLGENMNAFILVGALLILLVPYIKHYYLLENGTQKKYTYYDRVHEAEKKSLK